MKNFLLTGIFCLCFTVAFTQTKQHPLIPQSPTAAALGKYGDIDVSLYTGADKPYHQTFHHQVQ